MMSRHYTRVAKSELIDNATSVTAEAKKLLKRYRNKKFFLFLHYWDVHFGYAPPAPYDTLFDPAYEGPLARSSILGRRQIEAGMAGSDLDHVVALYDGEIAYTDACLGSLFRELDELGLSAKTLVVVTSDHGEELLEHGGSGHGHSLFQELIHVPMRNSSIRSSVDLGCGFICLSSFMAHQRPQL